jgi:membrane dipeptidase
MHCDSLTASLPVGGMSNFFGQVNAQKLVNGGCRAQCFAIFTNGNGAQKTFEDAINNYFSMLKNSSAVLMQAKSYGDVLTAVNLNKCAAILTVENLGFIGRDIERINKLKSLGVGMASLVWNDENCLAYPNVRAGDELFREGRGLKKMGVQALELLQNNNIIVDVSHLSDGGFYDVVRLSKVPIVASHSNCSAVKNVSRNLCDGQIKLLAERGGVMGINFSKNFLGGEGLNFVLDHVKHAINVGGEDVIAIGSDFDGTQTTQTLDGCDKVENLLNYLSLNGICGRALDKFAYKNFERIFKEVVSL